VLPASIIRTIASETSVGFYQTTHRNNPKTAIFRQMQSITSYPISLTSTLLVSFSTSIRFRSRFSLQGLRTKILQAGIYHPILPLIYTLLKVIPTFASHLLLLRQHCTSVANIIKTARDKIPSHLPETPAVSCFWYEGTSQLWSCSDQPRLNQTASHNTALPAATPTSQHYEQSVCMNHLRDTTVGRSLRWPCLTLVICATSFTVL
jgi:hypothetical protein